MKQKQLNELANKLSNKVLNTVSNSTFSESPFKRDFFY